MNTRILNYRKDAYINISFFGQINFIKRIALYLIIAQYIKISCSEILVICPQWGWGVAGSNPVVPTFFKLDYRILYN